MNEIEIRELIKWHEETLGRLGYQGEILAELRQYRHDFVSRISRKNSQKRK